MILAASTEKILRSFLKKKADRGINCIDATSSKYFIQGPIITLSLGREKVEGFWFGHDKIFPDLPIRLCNNITTPLISISLFPK